MIWLIGNRGMLGSDVESLLRENELEFQSSDLEVYITRIEQLRNFVSGGAGFIGSNFIRCVFNKTDFQGKFEAFRLLNARRNITIYRRFSLCRKVLKHLGNRN